MPVFDWIAHRLRLAADKKVYVVIACALSKLGQELDDFVGNAVTWKRRICALDFCVSCAF